MIREIYVHNSGDIAWHNFTIYLTRVILDGRHANVKIIDLLDFAKQDLNGFCTQNIGVSPFSKRVEELKLIQGLIDEYAFTIMEGSDPDWWVRKAEQQSSLIIKDLTDMTVCVGGINKENYFDFLKKKDKLIVGVQSPKEKLQLKDSLDKGLVLKLKQNFKVSSTEEICERELQAVEKFLTKAGVIE